MMMIVMCDALDVCHAIIYSTQFEFGASTRLYPALPQRNHMSHNLCQFNQRFN